MKTMHKIGLGIGAGALALGGAAGFTTLAQADTPTPTPTSSAGTDTTTSDEQRGRHGGRGLAGFAAAELAEKLGLEESVVADAIDAAQEATTDEDRTTRRAAFVTALADALGVEEATLTEAIEAIRTEQQAERRADLATRLDEAVAGGTLTQAEADAVTKAADAGVIGYGRGGRR